MDPFGAPEIGDPRATGTKLGNTSGTSTDIVYPVSKLVDGEFQAGRTLEFNFKSDAHRHVSLRNSRIALEFEVAYGEVNETASDIVKGADDKYARPSRSIRTCALPASAVFDSQVRFTANNVVMESVPNFYTQACAKLLTTTNIEGPNTSGANMLTSLRKDTGTVESIWLGAARGGSDAHSRMRVEPAEYFVDSTGKRHLIGTTTTVGDVLGDQGAGKVAVGTVAAEAASGQKIIYITEISGGAIKPTDVVSGTGIDGGSVVASVAQEGDKTWKVTLDKNTTAVVAADAALNFTSASAFDIEKLKVSRLANLLSIKQHASAHKDTIVNPKHSILQQGYVGDRSYCSTQEPLLLSTWEQPYALGPSDFSLFMTISPNWLKDILYDHAGAYGCYNGSGAAISPIPDTSTLKKGQVYISMKSVALHMHYIHPVQPYIPRSLSIRYQPMQISTHLLTDATVNITQIVPPSTRAVYLFMRQRFHHICADREELSKAAGGIVEMGTSDDPTTGRFRYYSKNLVNFRDVDVDARNTTLGATWGDRAATQPFTQLQVQLGDSIQPREALSMMDPDKGKLSRAFGLYTAFIGKSQGYRGSVMSYDEFCGFHNANFESGPGMGDRGPCFFFEIQSPAGSLATDLQIRGQLRASPGSLASQELVVVAVSDSLWNIGWQPPATAPVLTETNPIV